MPSILDNLPRPLIDDFLRGAWLPIVGAGFSRNASVPDGNPPADWETLGKSLAGELNDSGLSGGALESISAYAHEYGRERLIARTADLIRAHDAQPGTAHEAFARIGQFATVITTNFDFLLERAYERAGKRCLPIVDEAQLSSQSATSGPRVVKLHGDIHHPNHMVLTEDDYDLFLYRNPLLATVVTAMLVDRTPVLIGYSLDDPDTRHLLALIRDRLGRMARPLWSFQVGASAATVARFARRGVKVVNLPRARSRSYNDQLQMLFDELGRLAIRELRSDSVVTDERVAEELSVPSGTSLICYFAVPEKTIAWYRDAVFPIVEEYGLVPATSADLVAPASTLGTRVEALIEKSVCVVVESDGTPWRDYEASLARRMKPASNVLMVAGDTATTWPSEVFLIRPEEIAEQSRFLTAFERWIQTIDIGDRRLEREPQRLLGKGENRAAIVSAVTALEAALRDKFDSPTSQPRTRSPESALTLVDRAAAVGLISPNELAELRMAIQERNAIVHGQPPSQPSRLRDRVALISRITERLGNPESPTPR